MKKLALCGLLLLLGGRVHAEQVTSTKFRGINNNESSVIIEPEFGQDGLNFDVTPGGKSVKKRTGYGVYKALGTTAALHGGYHAYNSSGNNYQLWGSSRSLFSIVADATPVAIVSSATLSSTWDCTDTQGSSYCVDSNRDVYLKTDGTTISWNTSPLGTMVESTPDRVIVAGVSGAPNTLYVSQSNTFTNFTPGVNATDAFQEVIASPGSKLTHIRWGCGKLLWWKDQSFGYFDFDDQFTAQVKTISDSIGTFDNTSAIDPGGQVWFRGQDGHTWMYDCSILTKETVDITPNVQAAGQRVANSWTQTTQSDFQSGSIVPTGRLSTTISAGDVVVSSFSNTSTPSTYNFTDSFSNLNNWTALSGYSGTFSASGNTAICTNQECHSYAAGAAVPADFLIQATVKRPASSFSPFVAVSALNSSNKGYSAMAMSVSSGIVKVCLADYIAADGFVDGCQSALCIGSNSTSPGKLTLGRDNATNTLTAYINGSAICSAVDSTYTSFTRQGISMFDEGSGTNLSSFQQAERTITSSVLNSGFSSSTVQVQGYWSAGTSTPAFSIRHSTAQTGPFSTLMTSTGTNAVANQYLIYSSTVNVDGGALSAISSFTVISIATGTYYSAVNNAPNLTSWSSFGVNQALNGGTETFYIRSSTNAFTVLSSTPSWVAQSVGGLISASTGTYFQVRDDFGVTAATQTPTLSDFTVNSFEGSAGDQAYMLYFDNAIWESVAFGAGQSTNNYIFKYDLINEGWTLYNFGAGGLLIQSNRLYFGDTSTGGNVFSYGTATSDNGSSIQSFWRSKSYTGSDPFLQNALTNIDVFAKKDQGTTLTSTYTTDTSTATAYSISLSTSASVIQSRKLLPAGKLGNTFDLKLGDTSASSAWEILGYRIGFNQQPYRPTVP